MRSLSNPWSIEKGVQRIVRAQIARVSVGNRVDVLASARMSAFAVSRSIAAKLLPTLPRLSASLVTCDRLLRTPPRLGIAAREPLGYAAPCRRRRPSHA